MTEKDLNRVIEEARSNPQFRHKCILDIEEALADGGYQLTDVEKLKAQEEANKLQKEAFRKVPPDRNAATTQPDDRQKTADKVADTTLSILNNAIEDGRKAYRNLRLLSNATFVVGLFLFVTAAVSGVILQRETLSLVFGGLGAVSFVTIFIMNPKNEIQIGLSRLLKAQTIWLNFYDQLHFWAPYAQLGEMEERKQASQALDEATSFALEALEKYVEPRAKAQSVKSLNREANI